MKNTNLRLTPLWQTELNLTRAAMILTTNPRSLESPGYTNSDRCDEMNLFTHELIKLNRLNVYKTDCLCVQHNNTI